MSIKGEIIYASVQIDGLVAAGDSPFKLTIRLSDSEFGPLGTTVHHITDDARLVMVRQFIQSLIPSIEAERKISITLAMPPTPTGQQPIVPAILPPEGDPNDPDPVLEVEGPVNGAGQPVPAPAGPDAAVPAAEGAGLPGADGGTAAGPEEAGAVERRDADGDADRPAAG